MPRKDPVREFVNRKRREQQSMGSFQQRNGGSGLPPSMTDRYGLSSGYYTGAGGDGKVQPTRPTSNRVSVNGQPYGVDEGEVVIADSQTVKDYGGPKALDIAIQKNRPMNSMATPMGGNWASGGVPRYAMGGVPDISGATSDNNKSTKSSSAKTLSSPKFTPLRTPGATEHVKTEVDTATSTGKLETPKNTTFRPLRTPGSIDSVKTDVDMATSTGKLETPKTRMFTPLRAPKPTEYVRTDAEQATNSGAQETVYRGREALKPTESTTPQLSESEYDRMVMDRNVGRMQLAQDSDRAAEAQRLRQAGYDENQIQGFLARSDVGRRQQTSDTMAQMGISEAQRAEDRARYGQESQFRQQQFDEGTRQFDEQMSFQQEQFDLTKQKYGDQETQRLASDIAAGSTLEEINSKRQLEGKGPISEPEFNSIRDAGYLGERDYVRASAGLATALEAGDFESANQFMSDLYPGVNIDMSQIENDQAQYLVGVATGEMTEWNTLGMDWEDIPEETKKVWAENTGIEDPVELEKFYSNTKYNMIEQQVEDIMSLPFVNDLSTEDREALQLGIINAVIDGDIKVDESGKIILGDVGSFGNAVPDNTWDSMSTADKESAFRDTVPESAMPTTTAGWVGFIKQWEEAGRPQSYDEMIKNTDSENDPENDPDKKKSNIEYSVGDSNLDVENASRYGANFDGNIGTIGEDVIDGSGWVKLADGTTVYPFEYLVKLLDTNPTGVDENIKELLAKAYSIRHWSKYRDELPEGSTNEEKEQYFNNLIEKHKKSIEDVVSEYDEMFKHDDTYWNGIFDSYKSGTLTTFDISDTLSEYTGKDFVDRYEQVNKATGANVIYGSPLYKKMEGNVHNWNVDTSEDYVKSYNEDRWFHKAAQGKTPRKYGDKYTVWNDGKRQEIVVHETDPLNTGGIYNIDGNLSILKSLKNDWYTLTDIVTGDDITIKMENGNWKVK